MSAQPKRRRLNTVREVCQEYIARVLSTKTGRGWETHRVDITAFMDAKGDIDLDDLICDDLEKWIEDHPTWQSPWSKKRIAQTIKRPFSWAWNKGLIGSHPLKGVSYSRGERGKPLSEAQFRTLLRNVTVEYRRLFYFLWWTGCRPGELCALRWSHIDTQTATAVLQEHKTAHSTKEPRVIYLQPKAIRLLTWILDGQRPGEGFIFLNTRGRPLKRPHLSAEFRRIRRRLGLPKAARLYGCRHAFGTRLALAGVELKTLSLLMGHKNASMSEHYIHLAGQTEHLHKALDTIDPPGPNTPEPPEGGTNGKKENP